METQLNLALSHQSQLGKEAVEKYGSCVYPTSIPQHFDS